MGNKCSARPAIHERAPGDEVVLVVLFSQARIFDFPTIWRLRLVCRSWRNAIESTGVLSSHVAQRDHIAKLQGVAVSREGLRDLLLVDHIVDVVQMFETENFCTSSIRQSVWVSKQLGSLHGLSICAANAACSLLGSVCVVDKPGKYLIHDAKPIGVAGAALAVASAAAELASQSVRFDASRKLHIAIADLFDCGSGCFECMCDGGCFLIVPPGTSGSDACRALARAIRVFTRVCAIADEQRRWGERLVTAVTGAIPSRYMYPSPREDHLWVGMLLFPEHTRQLSGMHVDGNGAKHGVDPKKGSVMVPWNYFDKYLSKF
eukprot:m51a1_g10667 hypothetical protein (319) ;mRNA; f:9957-10913